VRRLALLGVVAVLVGCGGGSKPVSDAAELVPPSAQSFVSLQTDLGGLPHVLNRFPIGSAALKAVRQGLKLKPSMGPELDLAIFKAGTVSFTQPADEKALEAALGPKQLHARITRLDGVHGQSAAARSRAAPQGEAVRADRLPGCNRAAAGEWHRARVLDARSWRRGSH